MEKSRYHLMGQLVAATNKAIMLDVREAEGDGSRIKKFEPETKKVWLPLSQIADLERDIFHNEIGDEVVMTIPEWLARDKGFVS